MRCHCEGLYKILTSFQTLVSKKEATWRPDNNHSATINFYEKLLPVIVWSKKTLIKASCTNNTDRRKSILQLLLSKVYGCFPKKHSSWLIQLEDVFSVIIFLLSGRLWHVILWRQLQDTLEHKKLLSFSMINADDYFLTLLDVSYALHHCNAKKSFIYSHE